MDLVSLLKNHSDEIGDGVSSTLIKALEAKLDVLIPIDFKDYLLHLNYAEIFGDPIYGINQEVPEVDLYTQNKHSEHLRHGFLEVFCNDIDGAVFIRPDTGAVYNASFSKPIAGNFTAFVKVVLSDGS